MHPLQTGSSLKPPQNALNRINALARMICTDIQNLDQIAHSALLVEDVYTERSGHVVFVLNVEPAEQINAFHDSV